MDRRESLWLGLALGWRRRLDFSSEAGLLEMQVSGFLPGSPAEEAAERFAAERDVNVGLELARLLKAECEACGGERGARLADLAEFAELLCACLGDGTAAAAVARNLLGLAHARLHNDGFAPTELTIAAIGWLDASVRIEEIVASPNPPGDAVVMGRAVIQRYERAAIRRYRDLMENQASGKATKSQGGSPKPDLYRLRLPAGEAIALLEDLDGGLVDSSQEPEAPDRETLVVVAGVASGRSGVARDFEAVDGEPLDLVPVPDLVPLRTDLVAEFPHAAEVIDAVLGDLAGRRSIRMRPVLLVGSPGCGKSRLGRRLFELLDLPAITYPCGGISDSAFAGTARRWSSSEPSLPLRLIRDRACANPGILLDELDKPAAGNGGNGGRLWDALVGMLEPGAARVWLDPYVGTEVDLSAVVWMATANDLRPIPDVLLDRFRIVRMPEPSAADLPALAASMLAELCSERGQHEAWAGPLDGIELQALRRAWRGGSLRALRRLCEGVLAAREQVLPQA